METAAPYIYERRVRWGDCDPAGIIYTPRAFDYATEALEGWWRDVIGIDWVTLNRDHKLGAPMVHASCDYVRALAPDMTVSLAVRLDKIGTSTLRFLITGEDAAGTRYIEARFVACIVDLAAHKSIPIPAHIREKAETYQGRCPVK